jgi:hypothetical protein
MTIARLLVTLAVGALCAYLVHRDAKTLNWSGNRVANTPGKWALGCFILPGLCLILYIWQRPKAQARTDAKPIRPLSAPQPLQYVVPRANRASTQPNPVPDVPKDLFSS